MKQKRQNIEIDVNTNPFTFNTTSRSISPIRKHDETDVSLMRDQQELQRLRLKDEEQMRSIKLLRQELDDKDNSLLNVKKLYVQEMENSKAWLLKLKQYQREGTDNEHKLREAKVIAKKAHRDIGSISQYLDYSKSGDKYLLMDLDKLKSSIDEFKSIVEY